MPWPPSGPIRSQTVASVAAGTIVSLALVPGGVAALVKGPPGQAASILVVRSGQANQVQKLPAPPGMLIAQSLRSFGPALIVDGTVFNGRAIERVRWTSTGSAVWERFAS